LYLKIQVDRHRENGVFQFRKQKTVGEYHIEKWTLNIVEITRNTYRHCTGKMQIC